MEICKWFFSALDLQSLQVEGQNCSGMGESIEYRLPNRDIETKPGISVPLMPKKYMIILILTGLGSCTTAAF